MNRLDRKAFTMIELIFVIVVIGILSAIAIPKMAATRDDAQITKGLATLASVRSAIATERQKQILRGDFDGITSLHGAAGPSPFTTFNDANGSRVLEYGIESCTAKIGCWSGDGVDYTFRTPTEVCKYKLVNNRFVDDKGGDGCTEMK